MASWHFGSTRKWYINFGLYTGFLLNAQVTETGVDSSNLIQSVDIGFAAGIGYKFSISHNVHMFVEYDGQRGINAVLDFDTLKDTINSRSSFNIGVIFDLD